MSDESQRLLRRRRIVRITSLTIALAIAGTIVADRAGAFGYARDDVRRFDRRAATSIEVLDGEQFRARVDGDSGDGITVRLLGIDSPNSLVEHRGAEHGAGEHWADEAKEYLGARLAGRAVTLRLDGTQTRDASGALLALVYITDGDCLNADLIRDGQAYADRRTKHTFSTSFEQLERDARMKKRGLWKDLRDEDMPAWRLKWLRSLRKH